MPGPIRHRRFRRGAWLALLALWLQVLAPVLHESAMAAASSAGFDPAHHLCMAPGSQPADPASPDKAPPHHLPACALCLAIHAAGGFAPPATPVVVIARTSGAIVQAAEVPAMAPRWVRTRQQPRAPPSFA